MSPEAEGPEKRRPQQRKQVLLRLDPHVHDALARWAGEELRSTNAQIEFLLRHALREAGRLPQAVEPIRRRGRPPKRSVERAVERPTEPPADESDHGRH
ncbi:hypothetical protein HUT18_23425 [Streptomyces sp. NA04227]|uniref:hypothetical protein n=1 Tax=Streptomyces sp. NA04227 TaxID=2742136 RepID=UPI00159095B1|nr:hypothetical protein [Streptomyces sp. NA04227]QKW08889.1 hypothetical protein HUT18_23425 [Streptomyces sp. NA04227]